MHNKEVPKQKEKRRRRRRRRKRTKRKKYLGVVVVDGIVVAMMTRFDLALEGGKASKEALGDQ
jgi:hypothetical protein